MLLPKERYVTRNTGIEAVLNQGFRLVERVINNMIMTENETKKIVEAADFLHDKGYTRKIEEYAITFLGDGISILVGFEPYSDVGDVLIKFMDENEIYSVGWIACVRSGLNIKPHQRLENVLILLAYIRENYSSIISRVYCKESDKLIKEFIEKERRNKIL